MSDIDIINTPSAIAMIMTIMYAPALLLGLIFRAFAWRAHRVFGARSADCGGVCDLQSLKHRSGARGVVADRFDIYASSILVALGSRVRRIARFMARRSRVADVGSTICSLRIVGSRWRANAANPGVRLT